MIFKFSTGCCINKSNKSSKLASCNTIKHFIFGPSPQPPYSLNVPQGCLIPAWTPPIPLTSSCKSFRCNYNEMWFFVTVSSTILLNNSSAWFSTKQTSCSSCKLERMWTKISYVKCVIVVYNDNDVDQCPPLLLPKNRHNNHFLEAVQYQYLS